MERRGVRRCEYGGIGRVVVTIREREESFPVCVVDLSSRGASLVSTIDIPTDTGIVEIVTAGKLIPVKFRVNNRGHLSQFQSRTGFFHRAGVTFEQRIATDDCLQALSYLTSPA